MYTGLIQVQDFNVEWENSSAVIQFMMRHSK